MGSKTSKPTTNLTPVNPPNNINSAPIEPEKAREELENRQREEYYKKNALAISLHKQMLLQKALNKNFRIKLPIEKICDFPVDIYFVFEHVSVYTALTDKYFIHLHIYSAAGAASEKKLLYFENLSRFSVVVSFFDTVYYYYKNTNTLEDSITLLNTYLNHAKYTMMELQKDSYLECFTKDAIKLNHDYTALYSRFFNENIKYSDIYNCKKCGGQTKTECDACYFCAAISSARVEDADK